MNDIEAAEKVTAGLEDRRDRAAQRSIQITDERQKLGYEVFVNDSKEAKAAFAKLSIDFANLSDEMQGIAGQTGDERARRGQPSGGPPGAFLGGVVDEIARVVPHRKYRR